MVGGSLGEGGAVRDKNYRRRERLDRLRQILTDTGRVGYA